MEQGDLIAEPRAEAADRLWCQRNLGHEHDRPETAFQSRFAGAEVHLGLSAPGRAVEEKVAASCIDRADDTADRRGLCLREVNRPRLAAEAVPLGGGCLLLASRRLVRRD